LRSQLEVCGALPHSDPEPDGFADQLKYRAESESSGDPNSIPGSEARGEVFLRPYPYPLTKQETPARSMDALQRGLINSLLGERSQDRLPDHQRPRPILGSYPILGRLNAVRACLFTCL